MRKQIRTLVGWVMLAGAASAALAASPDGLDAFVGEEAVAKIKQALPPRPSAKPAKARRVLVFTESPRDLANAEKNKGQKFVPHPSAPHAARAVAMLGERTGAFAATISTDPAVFRDEKLKDFDAVVLANVYLERKLFRVPTDLRGKEKATYEARQKALMAFVRGGKGLVGIHNATCEALGWPEYQKTIGATHYGQAWWAHQAVPLKLDDPKHPINAAFGGEPVTVRDDIYAFSAPYTREAVHVLLSVDVAKAPASMTAERPDGDYPVSWTKAWGKGRVFYTSLGHQAETFQNAKFLRHLLDGIRFAA
ncbi:MAG TPA: ThuA domain-containing protein, partial [Phycisphaerae bacterium]|nr:ThuA domain-containing protein [Phycisphaerae bacterium]